jgi:hypothetical protein
MNAEDFEGSEILEKLAAIGKVDAFYEAVDADDIKKAIYLLRQAQVDSDCISEVLKKILEG